MSVDIDPEKVVNLYLRGWQRKDMAVFFGVTETQLNSFIIMEDGLGQKMREAKQAKRYALVEIYIDFLKGGMPKRQAAKKIGCRFAQNIETSWATKEQLQRINEVRPKMPQMGRKKSNRKQGRKL